MKQLGARPRFPARPIHERQLDEDLVTLQRAAAASHRCDQIMETVHNTTAPTFAAAGFVTTTTGYGSTALTIGGVVWFAVSFFLMRSDG